MKRSPLLLGVALAAVSGPALADDATITSQYTLPFLTSSAFNGSPGNLTINQGARLYIDTSGAAVTINSNNTVLNSGVIQNAASSNAVGVHLVAGNNGSLTLNGATNAILCLSTDCRVFSGNGTGNTGVLLDGNGTFTGSIDLQFGSSTVVVGTQATGVLINSQLTGNLNVTQIMTVSGEDSTAIRVNAPIVGEFTVGQAITARGVNIYSSTQVDALSNSAVAIGANVTSGFVVMGPGSSADTTVSGTLLNSGTAATVLIAPSVAGVNASNIVIGPRTSDAFGKQTFSFINRGLINASDNDPGVTGTSVLLGETGAATHTVNLTGGFYNRGRIVTTTESDNAFATGAASAPSNAYGVIVGNGATISNFSTSGNAGSGSTVSTIVLDGNASATNDFYKDLYVTVGNDTRVITGYDGTTKTATVGALNGSTSTFTTAPSTGDQFTIKRNAAFINEGSIQATTTGNQAVTAAALKILAQGSTASLINTGTISALASTTDTGVASLSAYGIQDLSGTLTNIVNTGSIAAAAAHVIQPTSRRPR